MKKICSSLLYCGALISLMSTNVYALEKDMHKEALRVNIVSVIYSISVIIYLIKSKKDLKSKFKALVIFYLIFRLILVLLDYMGRYYL